MGNLLDEGGIKNRTEYKRKSRWSLLLKIPAAFGSFYQKRGKVSASIA